MASSVYHSIVVQGAEDLVYKEAVAGGSITPGYLLAWSSGTLIAHGSAAGVKGTTMVAVETQTPDAATTAQISVAYASGDTVYYVTPRAGDVLYMLLKNGENVAKGDTLASAGDGTLQAISVGTSSLENAVVGVAFEAKNNTSGSAARILVEIV